MTKLDIIYTRVSTDEQATESKTSIPEQEAKCRDYLKPIGLSNIQVFREDYSGFSFERPELDKIRKLIRENKVRSLTFLRVDRLNRQSGHLDQLREGYFIPFGVEVYSTDLGKWEWTPNHIFLQNTLVNFSQMWGNIIIQILHDGKIAMVKNGNTSAAGQAPFGYTEIKTNDRAYFVINEAEAVTIRLIFRLFVDDGLSLRAIAERLNADNVPTYSAMRGGTTFGNPVSNSQWYPSTIRQFLRSPVYRGEWNFGKTKMVTTYDSSGKVAKKRVASDNTIIVAVPPIVDPETWQKVQAKLDHNRVEKRGRKTGYEYHLSKRLKCSCGYCLIASTKAKGRYLYYKCPSASGLVHDGRCEGRAYHDARLIDQKAVEWLKSIAFDAKELQRRIENYQLERQKVVEPLKERLGILDSLIEKEQAKYDKLIDLYLSSDVFSREMLEEKKTSLESRIADYRKEQDEVLGRIAELSDPIFDNPNYIPSINTVRMIEERERIERDFSERRKFIEKWDLRAQLVREDAKTYLYVSCKLDQTLLELYTHSLSSVQKRQSFYLMFADKLLLDFNGLTRFRQSVNV